MASKREIWHYSAIKFAEVQSSGGLNKSYAYTYFRHLRHLYGRYSSYS